MDKDHQMETGISKIFVIFKIKTTDIIKASSALLFVECLREGTS